MEPLIIIAAVLISLAIGLVVGMAVRRGKKISRISKNRSRKFKKRRDF